MLPQFFTCTSSKETGTYLFQNTVFCCVWKHNVPSFSWCTVQGVLGGRVVVQRELIWRWLCRAVGVPHPHLSLCAAPHTSWAPSEAPAQLHSPALKRAKKRVREWVWGGVWGTLKASAHCTAAAFIETAEAVDSGGNNVTARLLQELDFSLTLVKKFQNTKGNPSGKLPVNWSFSWVQIFSGVGGWRLSRRSSRSSACAAFNVHLDIRLPE